MITIITGGIKNVGDFLIGDRAKILLRKFVDNDIFEISRFDNLSKYVDQINKSRALILCGGPAYDTKIYENIYKLDKIIDKINVPIIPFGLGWSGKPFGQPEKFKFSEPSFKFLRDVHDRIKFSSCRDVITYSILNNNGFENVIMTGCPVWYDMKSLGKEFPEKLSPRKIVITTPASPLHLILNTKLVKLIRKEFSTAKIILSFHRGILFDKHTTFRSSIGYILMAFLAKLVDKNIQIKDVSYSLNKIEFYKECDFHIGFRVHAHLYFLSQRKPSLLINEDGRGEGMVLSLGQKVYNVTNKDLIGELKEHILTLKKSGLREFKNVREKIDSTFESSMKYFLNNLNKYLM